MVRVRFAPSPTGFLHIGSARTAIFNWLFARHEKGKFLLRIEDTDIKRSQAHFLQEILQDLKWLGLDWDEQPIFQSQRFPLYREKAEELVRKGKAYRDGEAIIFKVNPGRTISYNDLIHGVISVESEAIKDQVLLKSDGSPSYNFACVVDDVALGITHILRGDDHISNTPKQILFYEAFELDLPKFGHMPLILGQDGSKLSKRHGGVAVEEYRREGFLPEALANYLILLGWTPPDGREIIPFKEAVRLFDISRMSSVQAKFDLNKLRWMNSEYIMKSPENEIIPTLKNYLRQENINTDRLSDDYLKKTLELYRVRIKTLSEFWPLTDFLFSDNYSVEEGGREQFESAEVRQFLDDLIDRLEVMDTFRSDDLDCVFRSFAGERNIKPSKIIHPVRMAISGKTKGAGLFEIMELLGKKVVLERLRRAVHG